jgi:uncharacterized protein (TIGR03000 family)
MKRSMLVGMFASFLTLVVAVESTQAQVLRRRDRSWRTDSNYYGTDSGTISPSSMSGAQDIDSGLRQASYFSPALDSKTAGLRIIVPTPDARVWIEKSPTKQSGVNREFVSPPLEPGTDYHYMVRVTWMENGREMSAERNVPVKGGREIVVYFGNRPTEDLPGRPRRLFR